MSNVEVGDNGVRPDRQAAVENELIRMGDGDPPDDDCEWACRCRTPDGAIETTYWITQDGASEMEADSEQAVPGTVCVVFPLDETKFFKWRKEPE
jgi:hypothetical protein